MKIAREFKFCASHIVPGHPGKCARLHGHNWTVKVIYDGPIHKKTGMLMDFADLKKVVMPIVARLDHRHLNFYIKVPTAENIAIYFAHEIAAELGTFVTVVVRETDPTEAVFFGPEDYLMNKQADNEGWREPFEKFVAFKDRKAMAKWYNDLKKELDKQIEKVHDIGSELAAFEMYRASLDEHEAEKLLAELQYYDSLNLEKANIKDENH